MRYAEDRKHRIGVLRRNVWVATRLKVKTVLLSISGTSKPPKSWLTKFQFISIIHLPQGMNIIPCTLPVLNEILSSTQIFLLHYYILYSRAGKLIKVLSFRQTSHFFTTILIAIQLKSLCNNQYLDLTTFFNLN
jgi:hypothetical protein